MSEFFISDNKRKIFMQGLTNFFAAELEKTMNSFIRKQYGLDTYACGRCQAGVACTCSIPETDA